MTALFFDDMLDQPPPELPAGAHYLPKWLTLPQQRWIIGQFRRWAAGPVPIRPAMVHGHEMSVKTVCLGWHWRPYEYTREAVDVNGNRVLDFPDWMVRLGRDALIAVTGDRHAGDHYTPDTALANYYNETARMGMHQDKDERSPAPVVSLSIGDSCRFRFGNTRNRNRPYRDLRLSSGDLFVFGGPSRLAYHGVTKVYSGTAPENCGLARGRVNITMRVTGLPG